MPDVRKLFDAVAFIPAHIPPHDYQKMIFRLLASYERVTHEAGLGE